MSGPLQARILAALDSGPMSSTELAEAIGSAWAVRTLRRLEQRGQVHRCGRRHRPGRGCPPIVWALGPSRDDAHDDAHDVTDWMADAVIRDDPRSAEEYAYDMGISVSVARRRIAEARALGWLDDSMLPTDAGLAAAGRQGESPGHRSRR